MFQRVLFTLNILFTLLLFIHMKMKKMLIGAFLGMFAVAGVAVLPNTVNAATWSDFGKDPNGWGFGGQDTQYNPTVYGAKSFQKDNLIKTIQRAINWVLGILSFVALCLCLWGGFQMMTSGGDQKKYEAGINLLKWAAIGLAVIAISWLVVSLIFYLINTSAVEESNNW